MEPLNMGIGGMFAQDFLKAGPVNKDNYVPMEDDIFISAGKDKQRLIFGEPLEFTPEEKERVDEFDKYLNDNNLQVSSNYNFRERFRFFQGCGFNWEETYESIVKHEAFCNEILPVKTDNIQEYFENGMVYFYKRDKHFRPICIINCKKLVDTEIDDDQLLRVTVAIVQKVMGKFKNSTILDDGLKDGAVENWIVIIDCKDVGVTQVPKQKLKTMVKQLQKNYRGRLYKLYAVNMPFMLRALWSMLKGMWDKFTLKKMNIYGTGYEKDILEIVDPNCLEKQYGGNLENKESNFFPPELD